MRAKAALDVGHTSWAIAPEFSISSNANFACKNKSIRRGLAYHRKIYKKLSAWLGANPDLGLDFIEEPWFRRVVNGQRSMCQPDAVLLDNFTNSAIVVEVKMNWKDGRDEKLIDLYLQAAREAYGLETTWPLLITSNVAGYKGKPLLGLQQYEQCLAWRPGVITPVMLIP